MVSVNRSITVIIVVAVVCFGSIINAAAQAGGFDWSLPYYVSKTPHLTSSGFIAAEPNSPRVHVMWAEGTGSDKSNLQQLMDTIYYRSWDGQRWSSAMDVLVAPIGSSLNLCQLSVDRYDRLALLWTNQNELRLSFSPTSTAGNANSWETMVVSAASNEGDLVVDNDGVFHVLYVENHSDVVYVQSKDGGSTWSTPNHVSASNSSALAFSRPRLAVDNAGTVHATWSQNTEDNSWTVSGIWYAVSSDDGQTWSQATPLIQANGHGHSDVAADGRGNVYLVWFRSVGSVDGRYYALSTDKGKTWSEPRVIFPGQSGLPGLPNLLVDSAGRVQYVGGGHVIDADKIWYSYWTGDRWADPVVISGDQRFAEDAHASLAQGNRLLVTWSDVNAREIPFSWRLLDAPAVLKPPLELGITESAIEHRPVVPVETQVVIASSTPTWTSTQLPRALAGATPPPQPMPEMILLVSIVPALGLIGLVLMLAFSRRSRSMRG